jgi:hypothetical protein
MTDQLKFKPLASWETAQDRVTKLEDCLSKMHEVLSKAESCEPNSVSKYPYAYAFGEMRALVREAHIILKVHGRVAEPEMEGAQ